MKKRIGLQNQQQGGRRRGRGGEGGQLPTLRSSSAAFKRKFKQLEEDNHRKRWCKSKHGKGTHKASPKPDRKRARLQFNGLRPEQASMGAMAITGKIPFNDHLYSIRAGNIDDPFCPCGPSRETLLYILFSCDNPERVRLREKLLINADGEAITDLQELLKGCPQQAARYLALASRNRAYLNAGADLNGEEDSTESTP